jgi:peptidoglycan-N-acetylglucosamine deacetylase
LRATLWDSSSSAFSPESFRHYTIMPRISRHQLPSSALEKEYRRQVQLAAQDDAERQKSIRVGRVITGDPKLPYVAITFDDGPHGEISLKLLDLLKTLKLPSTFFVVGKQARKYPEIIERIALDGHELANHTYNHFRLPTIPLSEVPSELNRTRDLLQSIVGAPTRLFRPPGGEYNDAIQKIVEREGYTSILWTDDPADYKKERTSEQIERFILRDITPGGIILLHDGLPATMACLPSVVAKIRAKGLIFVTVSELIRLGNGLTHLQNLPFKLSKTAAT